MKKKIDVPFLMQFVYLFLVEGVLLYIMMVIHDRIAENLGGPCQLPEWLRF